MRISLLCLSLLGLLGCGSAGGEGEAAASPSEAAASSPAESAAPGAQQPARSTTNRSTTAVSALGRLEPQGGIVFISGPSDLVVVVQDLFVDRGDRVRSGQMVATLDTLEHAEAEIEVAKTEIVRVEAELANARREMQRSTELSRGQVAPEADREFWEGEVAVLEAELAGARAELASAESELERSRVYSPLAARVLEVHTWPGERVGEQGILEVARTDRMVAVAEVYETDIGRVRLGQRATVTSPALSEPLTGTVE
ncbi:MAG: HlyD family efflux transporter periplasmic adaptor subunit, partial [Thermoanaerobaculia bacterium]|nr:HlyD family efflux transporter periplasmic adaptor subunit [Thermoanaerobaculia bacterium]